VWDLALGRALATLEGHTSWVSGCAVTADGRRVVSASADQTLKVWDLASGRALATLEGHANVVRGCAVTADGRRVVSASEDQTLKVWDLASGACLLTHRANVGFFSVATIASAIIAGDATGGVWFLDLPSADSSERSNHASLGGEFRDRPERTVPADADPNKLVLPANPGAATASVGSTSTSHAVFVLHANAPPDTAFVRSELVPSLELAPDRILLSSELPLGQTLMGALEQGVVSSGVTVLVLSPTFLRDTWALVGEALASYVAVTGGTMVPLILADCDMPPRLNMQVPLDCRDPSTRPEAFRRLRALVTSALPAADNVPPTES
jgi:WD40 repeat protein